MATTIMEADFIKILEQLEAKKKVINEQSNLMRECGSLSELDQRIGLLLKEIRTLKQNMGELSDMTFTTCDKLETPYKVLQKSSELSNINEALTKLIRLCKRLDKIQESYPIATGGRKLSIKGDNEAINGSEIDEDTPLSIRLTLEVVDNFERAYQPLENILKTRKDLPYVHYAERVRKLKDSLQASS